MTIKSTKITVHQLKVLNDLTAKFHPAQLRKIILSLPFNPYPSNKLSFKKARVFIRTLENHLGITDIDEAKP